MIVASAPNAKESANCAACGFGKYAAVTSCAACPAGSYAGATGSTGCGQCPLGTTTAAAGATSSAACAPCPLGSWGGAAPGSRQPLARSAPPARARRPAPSPGAETAAEACLACPAGSYAGGAGAKACTRCAQGAYSSAAAQGVTALRRRREWEWEWGPRLAFRALRGGRYRQANPPTRRAHRLRGRRLRCLHLDRASSLPPCPPPCPRLLFRQVSRPPTRHGNRA